MTRRNRRALRVAAPLAGALLALFAASAGRLAGQRDTPQQSSADWLQRCRERDGDERAVHCELRTSTLSAVRDLTVDSRPNGGVTVSAWDRPEIRVEARIQAHASTGSEATSLASAVRIATSGGSVRAEGPDSRGRRGWSVSYVIFAPRETALSLASVNGALDVSGVLGDLDLSTVNGGIALRGVAGGVRAHTTNGGVRVELAGSGWRGEGLDLQTTNGGIDLVLPARFSARLVASTVHGNVSTDFPVTMQGRIGRRIDAVLGDGGPTVSLTTVNGGIRISRD